MKKEGFGVRTIARDFGLAISGGSDFHGQTKPDIQLGRGTGSLQVPFSCYEALARLV